MIMNYVVAPLPKGGSGEAAGGFIDTDMKFVDTNKIPPTPLYERGKCQSFTDLTTTTNELQTYITLACQL
jgi:hypothetical protein